MTGCTFKINNFLLFVVLLLSAGTVVPDSSAAQIEELLRFAEKNQTPKSVETERVETQESTGDMSTNEEPVSQNTATKTSGITESVKFTELTGTVNNIVPQLWPWLDKTGSLLSHNVHRGMIQGTGNTETVSVNLESPVARQSWASGYVLGRDLKSMVDERRDWKVAVETRQFLSGIEDAFFNHSRLSEEEFSETLNELDSIVSAARTKVLKEQKVLGELFRSEFKKKKGVKTSSGGFLYKVDSPGDNDIKADSEIELTVKETLIDGTVVSDMERDGILISKKRSELPPVIQEAVGYLRNHGSLTMVVPPELAYGDNGFSPLVPPGATMVYFLSIKDVRTLVKKKVN